MATTNPLSYTTYDFDSIKTQLETRLKATDAWKDTYESSTGQTMIEMLAATLQLAMFYLERRAEECYIDTAQNRSSVVNLCRLINYTPKRKISATGTLTFSIATAKSVRVYIPQYTSCQTVNGVKFVTTTDVTIEAGQTSVDVTAIEGSLITESFTGDGTADQELSIDDTAVENDDHTAITGFSAIRVTVAGEDWTKVTSFLSSTNTSKHYRLREELDQTMTVIFGDDIRGKAPETGDTITVRYIRSTGADGNVYETGKVTTLNDTIYDAASAETTVTVTNSTTMSGGDDEEGIEEIRTEAPDVFSTGDRAVTKNDFKALIQNYGSVADVNVWGENEESPPNYNMFNKVRIVMLIDGWADPTTSFKTALSDYLYEKSMLTVKYEYIDAQILNVIAMVDATVNEGYSLSQTESDIGTALDAEFVLGSTTKLGTSKYVSNLIETIDDLAAINYHHLTLEIKQTLSTSADSGYDYGATLYATPLKTSSVKVYVGSTQVAIDDGSGALTDQSSTYTVTGTVNYTTGAVNVNFTPDVSGESVYVRYRQDQNGDIIVGNKQVCKLDSTEVSSIAYVS